MTVLAHGPHGDFNVARSIRHPNNRIKVVQLPELSTVAGPLTQVGGPAVKTVETVKAVEGAGAGHGTPPLGTPSVHARLQPRRYR
jgi:hypothetical protein